MKMEEGAGAGAGAGTNDSAATTGVSTPTSTSTGTGAGGEQEKSPTELVRVTPGTPYCNPWPTYRKLSPTEFVKRYFKGEFGKVGGGTTVLQLLVPLPVLLLLLLLLLLTLLLLLLQPLLLLLCPLPLQNTAKASPTRHTLSFRKDYQTRRYWNECIQSFPSTGALLMVHRTRMLLL
jgi:hypothetical protein